jgi:hypothetical protein
VIAPAVLLRHHESGHASYRLSLGRSHRHRPDATLGVLTDGGTECILLDANGVPGVVADTFHLAVSSSPVSNQVDNENLRCSGYVDNPIGKALRFEAQDNGLVCGMGVYVEAALGFQQTWTWRQVIAASGRTTLTCHD